MHSGYFAYILTFLTAASCTFVLSPFCYPLAIKTGALDIPSDSRRMHKEIVPRLGGCAVFFSFCTSCAFFARYDSYTISCLAGGFITAVMGIFDDSFSLSAKSKVIFGLIAPCLSAYMIFLQSKETNPLSYKNLLFAIFAVLFLLLLQNSFNLIDGLNGICSFCAIFSSLSLFAISAINGESNLLTLALCGCAFGFLPHNFPKATMFLGDTGSLFFGFALGVCGLETIKDMSFIKGIVILSLIFIHPLSETATSVIRRLKKNKNPFAPDREHFHHKLTDAGFSQKNAALILSFASFLSGIGAVLINSF